MTAFHILVFLLVALAVVFLSRFSMHERGLDDPLDDVDGSFLNMGVIGENLSATHDAFLRFALDAGLDPQQGKESLGCMDMTLNLAGVRALVLWTYTPAITMDSDSSGNAKERVCVSMALPEALQGKTRGKALVIKPSKSTLPTEYAKEYDEAQVDVESKDGQLAKAVQEDRRLALLMHGLKGDQELAVKCQVQDGRFQLVTDRLVRTPEEAKALLDGAAELYRLVLDRIAAPIGSATSAVEGNSEAIAGGHASESNPTSAEDGGKALADGAPVDKSQADVALTGKALADGQLSGIVPEGSLGAVSVLDSDPGSREEESARLQQQMEHLPLQ